jgi:hypothetical protein
MAGRAEGRRRNMLKNRTHALAVKPGGRSSPNATWQHGKALRAVGDARPPEAENVESLDQYRPRTRKYEVSLTFSGQAGAAMDELMVSLNVETPNEVVLHAIPLLLSAQGKEILLRDPKTGVVEVVEA